ncbi:IS66 family insertion sequence element accessory protein TnpA [Sulfoacidibacillus thermotolerans]|uniref:IS66 family insertion sequence element accessory protein TnpA n=1 Tax=Sulfoacidibacillus thermotolerans TaxID=1765684 RepID=UPI001FE46DAB|nr:hypothetical protein [Sulfoacidibacillus thermotolerans]
MTKAGWNKIVAEFRTSGFTGADWCAAQQVKEHQLWNWVSQYTSGVDHDGRDDAKPRFIPMRLDESAMAMADNPLTVHVGPAVI